MLPHNSSAMVGADDLYSLTDLSWPDFFRDPARWPDNLNSKQSSTQSADFNHRATKQALWMDSRGSPSWVEELLDRGIMSEHFDGLTIDPTIADASLPSHIWACSRNKDLSRGVRMHNELLARGLDEKNYSDALITMYAHCGELQKAQTLLDMHDTETLVPWTALISSYTRKGEGQNALDCFEQMLRKGISPNAVTYVCVLKACAKVKAIDKGKQIHDEIMRQRLLEHSVELGNALVDMFAKCGAFSQAKIILKNLPFRNVVSWSALIAGYAQKKHGQQALECYEEMQLEGIRPDAVTYVSILKSCAAIGAINKGKQIHEEISRQGLLEHNRLLGGALVDMYAKCDGLLQAQSVLKKLPYCDVVSWSALIAGYARNGQGLQALECFEQMQQAGIFPDIVTYVCVLKSCSMIGAIDKGKQIHDEISRQGFLKHSVVLGNALVDMYAKCGALSRAHSVLENLPSRNVVSWNALITGYVQKGQGQQAVNCFEQMQREGISPNEVTFLCILKACAVIRAIDKGKQIHDEISNQGLLDHNIMLGNALVDMYAKCGALSQAQSILEKLSSGNVISWSALVSGYVQTEQGQEALECFEQMQREGIPPDAVTYLCVLKACALIRALDKGKKIHDEILRQGLLEHNVVVGNALVDMYAKCGALAQARSVLEKLPSRDVVTWNALIAGYAQEGEGDQALNCFEQMQCEGILPDSVTFLCLLHLCSHLGLVEKGQKLFDDMGVRYGLKPDLEGFSCMIDLLGRAGHLIKAVRLIQEMPFSANFAVWICLLSACHKWVDVNVGAWAFERAVELDECDGTAYILMVKIYVAAGMPEKAKDIEAMRIKNKAWKQSQSIAWTVSNFRGQKSVIDDTVCAESKQVT